MRRLTLISVSIILLTNLLYSQDIINETGTEGRFIVRDSEQQEALIVEDGNVEITGALKVDNLEEGSAGDKVVVWSEEDKQFKALYNMIPKSTINASIMAADSWTESSGDIYRATGNVGIGTTTPAFPLDIKPTVSGAAQLMRESDSYNYAINLKSLTNRGEILLYKNGAPTTKLTGYGSTYFNGGKVGIGTTDPQLQLHVLGPNGGHVNIGVEDDDGMWGTLGINDGGDYVALSHGKEPDTYWDTIVLKGGNVGVGTAAPLAKLHIQDSDLALQATALENEILTIEDSDAGLGLYSSNGGGYGSVFCLGEIISGSLNDKWSIYRTTSGNASQLRFSFGSSSEYWSNPTYLAFSNNGNVGIGTTSPDANLDVNGDIILGENGSRFMEIREITGTTGGVGTAVISVAYPSGYNKSNTRILDYQVYSTANTWYGQEQNFVYILETAVIKLWYPNAGSFQSRPYRAILMRMP